MDITHYEGQYYLTLIDCGPSRYATWCHLKDKTSACVIQVLNAIFLELGSPNKILTDNDAAFRSTLFSQFMKKWNVKLRFRCAYVPSGNGIAERCHRTVKRTAKGIPCSILEAAYWYNVSPKDCYKSSTAPANKLYQYEIRVRGIDDNKNAFDPYKKKTNKLKLGDKLWVKPPENRCDSQYKIGRITRIISEQTVEVNKMCRHIRDLRHVKVDNDSNEDLEDDEELYIVLPEDETNKTPMLRRSTRERKAPERYSP